MQVFKVEIQELPTSILQEKFHEEWERVSDILIRIYPISDESLQMMLRELIILNEEFERRNELIGSIKQIKGKTTY